MKAGAGLPGRLASGLRRLLSSAWFGALLALLAVALVAYIGRAPAPPPGKERPAGAEARETPGFHFRDIRFVGRTAGKRDWELEVAKVTAPRDGERVDFYYVRRGVVYREGQPYLNLTADGGVYYPQQNNFLMRGHVVVSRANGDLLRGEELQWNPLTRQVTSPQPVEAKVEGIWFRANRLVVDVETETMIASGQVELVKDNGERMTGDTIIYSLKDAKWEIQGPVEFTIRLGGDDEEAFVAPGLGQTRSEQE
ncbi:MAG: LPS export ABC transporter periplasmic protein LptC [Chitinophagales bacterium]